VADPEILKVVEDSVSASSSFIAKEHNELGLYAIYTGKDGLLKKI